MELLNELSPIRKMQAFEPQILAHQFCDVKTVLTCLMLCLAMPRSSKKVTTGFMSCFHTQRSSLQVPGMLTIGTTFEGPGRPCHTYDSVSG